MDDPIAIHNEAIALRRRGRSNDALLEIERALRLGSRFIETRLMHAHLLADVGQFDEAVSTYKTLLSEKPDLIDAHETLAKLLPQIGRGAEALDSYRVALKQMPHIGMLWVSAMGSAKALGEPAQLLAWARAAEARFGADTMIAVFAAYALSATHQDIEARDLLVTAITAEPDYVPAQTTLAHIILKMGDYKGAERAALAATALAPHDQSAWALLSIIWRVLDDPREQWLVDYDQMVMPIDLVGLNLPALTDLLNDKHQTQDHPADQSLRGGSQTRGTLFENEEPLLHSLQHTITRAVLQQLATLPADPTHPFLSRMGRGISFAGSWSVRLRSAGFHINHMHPEGWLSSALYIDLPAEIGESDIGALAFGKPDGALGLNLSARRIVQPRSGLLVIFPSFFWHGTLPFESVSNRLTVAFDAIPT